MVKFLIILYSTVVTTAVFGQTTYTWTGTGNPTNIANANNWTPAGGPPNGATGDTGQWDGVVAGNLTITYTFAGGLPGTGFNTKGVNWNLTSNQAGSVTIISPVDNSQNIAFYNFNIADGAGALTLGDSTIHQLNLLGRPAGAVHIMVNNSANTATINGSVRWQAGGGTAYVLDFGGSGNWVVNNYLRCDDGGPTTFQKDGPGTMTWTSSTTIPKGNAAAGPVIINGGTMILKSPNLVPFENPAANPAGNNVIINNGTLLEFDAPAQSDNISRVISGTGPLQVNNGTWTFSGTNTYTGNSLLSGGEFVAGSAENAGTFGPLGVGGTIIFTGGTLGFSVNNNFDYSSRFSTAAGQAYSVDTGGQSVTFTNALGGSGSTLTKAGSGNLILAGTSSYSGTTTTSSGKLVIQGSKSGTGNITVADGATLGITATGTQVTPGTLTVGTSGGATLEFNNVNSTTTAPIAAGTLSTAGTLIININSGTFVVGQSYPLLAWTTGTIPAVSLGSVNGALGYLSANGNTIQFNVAAPLNWTGNNNGSWDTVTANNWTHNGSATVFANGIPALFDDSALGTSTVTIDALVQPSNLIISNNVLTYGITSTGENNIGGSTGLTKSGTGTLTLSGGANTYTGVTAVNGGTLSVSTLGNGGSTSDLGAADNSAANLMLNGGTLSYTGTGVSIDRLFTLGTSGGTIEASGSGALNLTNSGSVAVDGTGQRTLTLTGTNPANTFAAVLSDSFSGASSLNKSGSGKWALSGNNTYSGGTTINSGVLQVGTGGMAGTIGAGDIINNGNLDFNRTGTLTVSGAISGIGSVTSDGTGTIILTGNNSYSGDTVINSGTLQIGNGGNGGSIGSGPVTDDGTLAFNCSTGVTWTNVISGSGSLILNSGSLTLTADNTYSGLTTIDLGSTLYIGNGGATGKLNLNAGVVNNGALIFKSSGDFTLNGIISGTGYIMKYGSGTLTLTATNTYTDDTLVRDGTLIINGVFAASPVFIQGGALGGTGTLLEAQIDAGATLAPGASAGSVGTLSVDKVYFFGGNLAIEVNKSLSPSNDFVVVGELADNLGTGTVTVANLGPALNIGDKFTLFSQPVSDGENFTITGAGATWANNLDVDGSITVTSLSRPTLKLSQTNNSLQFSWETSLGTYRLQAQTNSLSVGISNNWVEYPGGGKSPVTVLANAMNEAVFFRLVSP